jgi:hypothetical protein
LRGIRGAAGYAGRGRGNRTLTDSAMVMLTPRITRQIAPAVSAATT